ADQGRKKNEKNGLEPAAKDNGLETGVRHSGATVTGDQCMRGTGGQAENESDQIPSDSAEQTGEHDFFVDHFEVNQALGNCLGDGGFDDFEDFFPLDDLDGIFLFVEELGDKRAAKAVAFVFVAIDLDAVLEGFLRGFECADGSLHFGGGGDENLDEVHSAGPN